MSERTREALDTVLGFLAFLLATFAFLLVGLPISLTDPADAAPCIAWAVLATVLGRAFIVYGLPGGASHLRAFRGRHVPLSRGWLNIMFSSGLRGAVAVALALSLPADTPQRPPLQAIIFSVVVVTLVIQGSTAELVVRRSVERPAAGDASRGRDEPVVVIGGLRGRHREHGPGAVGEADRAIRADIHAGLTLTCGRAC